MRLRKLLALFAVLAMIAAACGGDDAGDDTTTTQADVTTTTQAAATTTTAADTTTTTAAPDPTADWPDRIIFGFIPSERQEELQDNIKPFMDAIADRIGIDVTGIVTADYNGLVVAMGTGGVDFGAFGPFGYVQAKNQFPDLEVLIQSIRFGSDLYHGQWFTNDASICEEDPVVGAWEIVDGTPQIFELPAEADMVKALQVGWQGGNVEQELLDDGTPVEPGLVCKADLEVVRGKSIAFTSSTSTSGAVFPQLQLLNLGFDLEEDIEFEYLGSHDNTVAAVYNGDFDIGLSYDDARRTLRRDEPDVGSKVIVFNITDNIPNDVVAVRGELPDSLQTAVYDAIADYLTTEEGEAILDEIYGWTDIRPAAEEDFAIVREAADALGVTGD